MRNLTAEFIRATELALNSATSVVPFAQQRALYQVSLPRFTVEELEWFRRPLR